MHDWNEIREASNKSHYAPVYNKICPMISNPEIPAECVSKECAWWDGKYGRCAVLSQACKK